MIYFCSFDTNQNLKTLKQLAEPEGSREPGRLSRTRTEPDRRSKKCHLCLDEVKINVFKAYWTSWSSDPLWWKFKILQKLQVDSNDSLRNLLQKQDQLCSETFNMSGRSRRSWQMGSIRFCVVCAAPWTDLFHVFTSFCHWKHRYANL